MSTTLELRGKENDAVSFVDLEGSGELGSHEDFTDEADWIGDVENTELVEGLVVLGPEVVSMLHGVAKNSSHVVGSAWVIVRDLLRLSRLSRLLSGERSIEYRAVELLFARVDRQFVFLSVIRQHIIYSMSSYPE